VHNRSLVLSDLRDRRVLNRSSRSSRNNNRNKNAQPNRLHQAAVRAKARNHKSKTQMTRMKR
jgi:hypothetical protein